MSTTHNHTSASPELDAQLGRSLTDELSLLQSFVDQLQQEHQLLTANQLEELGPLIEEKGRLAGLLAQVAEQRNAILTAVGYPKDRPGVEAWLQQQIVPDSRHDNWQGILKLAAQARHLNTDNGKLIATRLHFNQQTLNTLLAASDQAALYGPDGQPHAGGAGRSFGSV